MSEEEIIKILIKRGIINPCSSCGNEKHNLYSDSILVTKCDGKILIKIDAYTLICKKCFKISQYAKRINEI